MNLLKAQKLTYAVNSVILLLVIGLACFFYMADAPFLVYFSIPTALIYLVGYCLIARGWLNLYVWMVYLWLTLYMCITTACLGYDYGFHLYCFSMIPVMFVTEYIAYRLERKSLRALYVSLGIGLIYLLSTGYVALFGPVYQGDHKWAAVLWGVNALIVFGFLIFYTNYLIKLIISSEEKLQKMAQVDQLTKLYNRHYMTGRLDSAKDNGVTGFLAMADIDNFKKINDQYGHAAGDEVLMVIANAMKTVCKDCDIARWGGEEFLIYSEKVENGVELMETLREKISAEPALWEQKQIPVTITVGISLREEGRSVDAWIQDADQKLYYGKNHGKNMVVE